MAELETHRLGEVNRVLGDISNAKLNYSETKKIVEEYDGITIEGDLHQTKEHFGKLKFNFIELETKKEFLLRIKTHNVDDQLPPLETVCTEQKTKLKEIKESNEQVKKELEAQSATFAEVYDSMQAANTRTLSQYEELENLVEKNSALETQLKVQRDLIGSDLDPKHIQQQLSDYTDKQSALQQTVTVEEAELKALEAEADMLEAEVDLKTTQLSEAKAQVKTLQNSRKQEGIKLSEEMEWHKFMSGCYAKLGGVTIKSISNQALELGCDVGGFSHRVVITADVLRLLSSNVPPITTHPSEPIVSAVSVDGKTFRFDQRTVTSTNCLNLLLSQIQAHLDPRG